MILGVDAETCSAADIDDGVAPYAEHETTRVHCVVFVHSDPHGPRWAHRWFPGQPLHPTVEKLIREGCSLLAHNASFEISIWKHILGPIYGFPEPRPEQWNDTIQVAAATNLPLGLGALGATIGAQALKDEAGRKIMLEASKVRRGPAGWVYPVLTPELLTRITNYCEQDVHAMLDCWYRLPSLPIEEHHMMRVDRKINGRGALIDLNLAAAMVRMANERAHQIGGEVWDETGDLISATHAPALTRWLQDRGIELPTVTRKRTDGTFHKTVSIDRGSVGQILARPELPPDVRIVLEARIEAGRVTSLAKAARVPDVVSTDQRLRFALRYCGAHTGRWSSKGLQLHNLARPSADFKLLAPEFAAAVRAGNIEHASMLYPVLEGLSFMLRSLVIAPAGKELLGGDYASVEARGMAWVSIFDEKLEVFRRYDAATGAEKKLLDPYVIAAAKIGSDNRQLGKICELALQYGMGAIKFAATAARAGIALSLKDARAIQLAWRRANKPIVDFWHELQNAVANAIHENDKTFQVGRVVVVADKMSLRILLPSGRTLYYWRPSQRDVLKEIETVNAEGVIIKDKVMMRELRFFTAMGRGMEAETTYGGKLSENVVQAICRDILAVALQRLDVTQYDVVLHVHDSIAAEVTSGQGSVEEFCGVMSTPPRWADGFPIAVDGYRARHFKG